MSGSLLLSVFNCFVAFGLMVYSLRLLAMCKARYRRLCILPVFTCCSYIILETEWILSQRAESIGELADYAWLTCEFGWMLCVWVALYVLTTSKGVCDSANK